MAVCKQHAVSKPLLCMAVAQQGPPEVPRPLRSRHHLSTRCATRQRSRIVATGARARRQHCRGIQWLVGVLQHTVSQQQVEQTLHGCLRLGAYGPKVPPGGAHAALVLQDLQYPIVPHSQGSGQARAPRGGHQVGGKGWVGVQQGDEGERSIPGIDYPVCGRMCCDAMCCEESAYTMVVYLCTVVGEHNGIASTN